MYVLIVPWRDWIGGPASASGDDGQSMQPALYPASCPCILVMHPARPAICTMHWHDWIPLHAEHATAKADDDRHRRMMHHA